MQISIKIEFKLNNNNVENEKEKQKGEVKKCKVERKKKIRFFTPKINGICTDNYLKLHLNLYHTFKEFGEAYSGNVVKNIKKV